MDGLCAFMNAHASLYPRFVFNDEQKFFCVSKVQPCQNTVLELQKSTTSDSFIRSLYSAQNNSGRSQNESDVGVLRLVWVRLDKEKIPSRLDIKQKDLELVLDTFNIEAAFRYMFTAPGGMTVLPVKENEKSRRIVCCVWIVDFFAVIWNHDFATHETSALCWGGTFGVPTMQNTLEHQKPLCVHAMFPALLAASMLGRLLDCELLRENRSIAEVENRTRYQPIRNTASGTAGGSYSSLSAKMSGSACALAGLERIAKLLLVILDKISAFQMPQQGVIEPHRDLDKMNEAMEECVGALRDRLQMEELQIKFLNRRVEVQLTALFNLIAQKESRISIAVAEDSRTIASSSKEDSSAMKTLAAVTVAFLPGTFVASFFAMPLFQWDAEVPKSVLSKYFWIYWAVTVPLTIVTVGVWMLWTKSAGSKHRRQQRMGKDRLWSEIDGTEDHLEEKKGV